MSQPAILVAAADLFLRRIVTGAVEGAGIHVVYAENASAALEALDDWDEHGQPLAILADMMMPESDGIEFMRGLAERGCRLPLITMTTSSEEYLLRIAADLGEAWGLNLVDGLPKPLDLRRLLRTLLNLRAVTDAAAAERPVILVVDDDDVCRELMVAIFSGAGFGVRSAASGAEALEILRRGDPVGLLFSDLRMPGMNGFALAAEAARLRPDVKILLTSGAPLDEETSLPFVEKPFKNDRLLEVARATIGG